MRCTHEDCPTGALTRLFRKGLEFDEQWYCGTTCLAAETAERLAALQPPVPEVRVASVSPVRLGATLVASRLIPREVLTRALTAQGESGLPLGAQLVAMGAVDEETVTHALATQARIGFLPKVDVHTVMRPVADLSRAVVIALGVVPLEVERDGTLRIAVGAPLPRTAIAALQSGTNRRVRPYLVGDSLLKQLLDAYGTAVDDSPATGVGRLSTAQAARRIADAAGAGRANSWHHTWGPGFAWIRVDGASGSEDLILAATHTE
ncbi:MAG TPA: hypothetical protein VMF13_23480 [Luteitalea sp.]|nr:hypothetical protein [Luteitalea sp.]